MALDCHTPTVVHVNFCLLKIITTLVTSSTKYKCPFEEFVLFSLFLLFLVGSTAVDSSPVKPPPGSDWLTEFSDAEETLVNSASESEPDTSQPAPTFFRSFIFSPEVPIRLDYQGKRVDMEQVKILLSGEYRGLKDSGQSHFRR